MTTSAGWPSVKFSSSRVNVLPVVVATVVVLFPSPSCAHTAPAKTVVSSSNCRLYFIITVVVVLSEGASWEDVL